MARHAWKFSGLELNNATIVLSYQGRVTGEKLVNTIQCELENPAEEDLARLVSFSQWLSSELGWELTETVS